MKAINFFNIASNLNYDKAKYELALIYLNDNYSDVIISMHMNY